MNNKGIHEIFPGVALNEVIGESAVEVKSKSYLVPILAIAVVIGVVYVLSKNEEYTN